MDRAMFPIRCFKRRRLLAILALFFLFIVSTPQSAWCLTEEPGKEQVIRKTVQDWIEVGMEQHRRGLYRQAEKSFLLAKDDQQYLTAIEVGQLEELLDNAHLAVVERERISTNLEAADALIKNNELAKAVVYIDKIRRSEFLTALERQQIAEYSRKINYQRNESPENERPGNGREREIKAIFESSMEFYRIGEYEQAREGFLRIDGILSKMVNSLQLPERGLKPVSGDLAVEEELTLEEIESVLEPELGTKGRRSVDVDGVGATVAVAEPDKAEPTADDGQDSEAGVSREEVIRRNYTRAVVSDAVAKAQDYIIVGKLKDAAEVVEAAFQVVNENLLYLDEASVEKYDMQLKQLAEMIAQADY